MFENRTTHMTFCWIALALHSYFLVWSNPWRQGRAGDYGFSLNGVAKYQYEQGGGENLVCVAIWDGATLAFVEQQGKLKLIRWQNWRLGDVFVAPLNDGVHCDRSLLHRGDGLAAQHRRNNQIQSVVWCQCIHCCERTWFCVPKLLLWVNGDFVTNPSLGTATSLVARIHSSAKSVVPG